MSGFRVYAEEIRINNSFKILKSKIPANSAKHAADFAGKQLMRQPLFLGRHPKLH